MSKNWILIIFIITVAGILLYLYYPRKTSNISLEIKGANFDLEVATTFSQRATGLMNRTSLCTNCGMIFVFESQIPLSFWMKNTLIPLDLIFLDSKGYVINIEQGVPQSLANINSLAPAKYVIELNLGTSKNLNLKPGDSINLPW